MKNKLIKIAVVNFAIAAFIIMGSSSCKIADQIDLNAPSVSSIESDASISELNNVVTGMFSGQRNNYYFYLDDCAIIGRDWYRFSSADPRFTSDIPGTGSAILDNNTFYIINPWGAFYAVIRNGWVLRTAIANTTAPLTDEQKNGYLGIAKTIQALEMLWLSNLTYTNPDGCIRVDVENPDKLGDFVDYNTALISIGNLLDDGLNDLQLSGDAFVAPFPSGFTGFDTPQTFAQFNRAVRARVDVYQGDWDAALNDLSQSFYNLSGDLNAGCSISYSTQSGDIPNDVNKGVYISIPNAATNARVAVNFWVDDAEAGDLRLSKVIARDETATSGELSSDYDVAIWHSQDDNISIIRNEELILIGAEAKIQKGDLAGGTANLNVVREAAGLPDLSPGMSQSDLTDQMLTERRYSLFGEGHRWIDMRRYGRLDQIQTQNADENVWDYFPIPANEQ